MEKQPSIKLMTGSKFVVPEKRPPKKSAVQVMKHNKMKETTATTLHTVSKKMIDAASRIRMALYKPQDDFDCEATLSDLRELSILTTMLEAELEKLTEPEPPEPDDPEPSNNPGGPDVWMFR